MKKFEIYIIALILFLGLIVRLYKIDRPIADWHSWRQADTAAVARNFIKEGFNPFVPRYDDMSSQANGKDNHQRYRFVEFPIYNSIIALVWKFTGVNVAYARLVNVFFSLGSAVLLYLVVRQFSNYKVASFASAFFTFLPYNIFYSSSILPGPFMVTATLALYYSFIKFLEKEKIIYLISSIFLANVAILSWPIAAFFFLPLLYLTWEKYNSKMFKNIKLYLFAVLSLTPFFAWRIWILNFPEGIPNWNFLLNEGGIRTKGAFFRWIIGERLGNLILTAGGFTLFTLGIARKVQKEKFFYLSLLVSSALYIIVFASGNVRHDYYQVPIIPTLSIFAGLGLYTLFELKSQVISKYAGPAIAVFLTLVILALGYFEIRGFYWINKPQIVEAGIAADKILPKDAIVIAPYNGDAAFLYQTNRRGYPIVDRPIEQMIDKGAKYLISVEPEDPGIKNLSEDCNTLSKTASYVIVEISKNCIGK